MIYQRKQHPNWLAENYSQFNHVQVIFNFTSRYIESSGNELTMQKAAQLFSTANFHFDC